MLALGLAFALLFHVLARLVRTVCGFGKTAGNESANRPRYSAAEIYLVWPIAFAVILFFSYYAWIYLLSLNLVVVIVAFQICLLLPLFVARKSGNFLIVNAFLLIFLVFSLAEVAGAEWREGRASAFLPPPKALPHCNRSHL